MFPKAKESCIPDREEDDFAGLAGVGRIEQKEGDGEDQLCPLLPPPDKGELCRAGDIHWRAGFGQKAGFLLCPREEYLGLSPSP